MLINVQNRSLYAS